MPFAEMIEREGLPRHVSVGFTLVEDIDDVHEQREILKVHQTQFGLAAYGLPHHPGNHKALEGDSGKSIGDFEKKDLFETKGDLLKSL